MTPTEFRKNQNLREIWASLLADPAAREAFKAARQLGEPVEINVPPGVDLVAFNALQNRAREGYFQALQVLEALAEPIIPQKTSADLMESLDPNA